MLLISKLKIIFLLIDFENRIYNAGDYESEKILNIMKVNCIIIECNLISNSFNDDTIIQITHAFYLSVPPS